MNYDECPTRGKETSDGEKIIKCRCGGRCYMSYRERERYVPICEKCGELGVFRAKSMDEAIKYWNEIRSKMNNMPNIEVQNERN